MACDQLDFRLQHPSQDDRSVLEELSGRRVRRCRGRYTHTYVLRSYTERSNIDFSLASSDDRTGHCRDCCLCPTTCAYRRRKNKTYIDSIISAATYGVGNIEDIVTILYHSATPHPNHLFHIYTSSCHFNVNATLSSKTLESGPDLES